MAKIRTNLFIRTIRCRMGNIICKVSELGKSYIARISPYALQRPGKTERGTASATGALQIGKCVCTGCKSRLSRSMQDSRYEGSGLPTKLPSPTAPIRRRSRGSNAAAELMSGLFEFVDPYL